MKRWYRLRDLNREALLRKNKVRDAGLNQNPATVNVMYRVRDLNREALLRKNRVWDILFNKDSTSEKMVPRTGFEPRSTASQ